MTTRNLTVEILKDIRSEIRSTREELSQTREALSQRIDATNERLDATRTELVTRIHDTEVRVATELVTVAGILREIRDGMADQRSLRESVEDHDRRIAVLERRAG